MKQCYQIPYTLPVGIQMFTKYGVGFVCIIEYLMAWNKINYILYKIVLILPNNISF